MTLKKHLILFAIGFSAWLIYFLLGLPFNYFQDWSTAEQVLLSLSTIFGAAPIIALFTIIFFSGNYIKTGIWLAFYSSVPLIFLDFLVSGIILKGGISIFITHWYVTIGYIYVWIIGPAFGFLLTKLKEEIRNSDELF